jgi:hypothetical protein
MEFDTEPTITHIMDHLIRDKIRDKSTERLIAFKTYNEDLEQYDHCLLLVTPSTSLSLELDREQAEDLIDVLRNAFELDGGRNEQYACKEAYYDLPSPSPPSSSSRSKKRKK